MGAPEHISDTDITEALSALPDITAAEVAGTLGIGRSTAAKRLARLEAAGTIRRNPGGRSGGARIADRWSLATATPETQPPAGRRARVRPPPRTRLRLLPSPTRAIPGLAQAPAPRRRAMPASGSPLARSAPWYASTWRLGPPSPSVRPGSARRLGGRPARCPMPSRPWLRPARCSSSPNALGAIGSPARTSPTRGRD